MNKFDISNVLIQNIKLGTLAIKSEQDEIMRLQTHNLSYFLGKNLFGDDSSQNILVCKPAFHMLQLKKGKDTNYVFSGKSNSVVTSNLTPLYTDFFHNIKLSGNILEIKFDKDSFPVERNNYTTKVVKAYIFYDLDP